MMHGTTVGAGRLKPGNRWNCPHARETVII